MKPPWGAFKIGLKCEGTSLVDLRSTQTSVLRLVIGEVLVHDVEALLVDVQVLVVLQVVDRNHTTALFDVRAYALGSLRQLLRGPSRLP